MSDILKMYIGGQWKLSDSQKVREIINPATGEVISAVTEGNEADVIEAVKVAKEAFYNSEWRTTPAIVRGKLLIKIAEYLENNAEELSILETKNSGKCLRESSADVQDAANCFRYYAGIVSKPSGQTYEVPENMRTMVVREPIGVCGQIIPWNYPLLMSAWKLAPALAAGNTVVFKPSELTPLTAIKVFEYIDAAGFPKGVANLVLGEGATVGKEISENTDIDKIAFTGGTKTGRNIMKAAAINIKNISLELGGKSPNIVFDDADYEAALDYALFGIFVNQGQVCSAGSRLILQDTIYDKFIKDLVKRANSIKVGNGLSADTQMGPLVSKRHMEKVLEYIKIGIDEGAKLECGGNRIIGGEYSNGFFVEPTIFSDTTPDMRIIQEEIFGPVLCIQKFKDEKEAVYLANHTDYGLAAGVFTNDGAKAQRVIKEVRAGITWINCYHPTYNEAPWGGYKQSGIGRELGTFGYDEYTEVKQININMDVQPTGWF